MAHTSISREVAASLALTQDDINLQKFGFNPDIDTAEESIWYQGGLYNWKASASTLNLSSSSANDAAAGTGAQTVQIYGADGDYVEQNEIVTMNGQTEVATSNSYLRIWRMIVRSAGSGGVNAGTIYASTGGVTGGVPDDSGQIFATIGVDGTAGGLNQTLMAIWTVPAERTLYLRRVFVTGAASNANNILTIRALLRQPGETFRTALLFQTQRDQGSIDFTLDPASAIPEKTDIDIRAYASGNNTDVACLFNGVYVDNSTSPWF